MWMKKEREMGEEKKVDDIEQRIEQRQVKYFRGEIIKRLKNEQHLSLLKVIYYMLDK